MRRRVFIISAATLLAHSPQALALKDIRLGAQWKRGERRRLELVETLERSRDGQVALRGRIEREVDLEVLAAAPTGFRVRWSFRTARTGAMAELPVEEWLKVLQGVSVEVECSNAGDFNAIRDWQKTASEARAAAERLLKDNPALPEAQQAEFRRLVESVFSGQRNIEAFFAKEIRLCTFVLGWYISPGKPERYPDFLPNPFGEEPFPSKATLLLTAYDAATGRAELKWWQNLDPVEARRILRESAEAEAKRLGKPAPDPAAVPTLSISDAAEISLDNHTGWLRSLRNRRTTVLRKDAVEMRDVRVLEIRDTTKR